MRENALVEPFFEALADDAFAVQRCLKCDHAFLPPGPVCPDCHARAVTWERTDGRGTLHAFTELHRTPPGFDAPAVVGTVLVEAVRVLTRVDAAYDDLSIGDAVELTAAEYTQDYDRGRWTDAPFFVATPV